ncbi:MAG: HK97 family phage prohead protease [Oscillospiraceae bacterium]|nr:HK97 family phage prohead protease [Oscillospiraceae bacterium]
MEIRFNGNTVEIDGYVNAVERLSKPLNTRLGGKFRERIKKGAFKRAIDRAEDVRLLINHDWGKNLGGTKNGVLTLTEDAIGLRARAITDDAEAVRKARAGEFVGWSFGFNDVENGVERAEEDGITTRNVNDLDLLEVSLLDKSRRPAYEGTLVSVRDDKTIFYGDGIEDQPITREDKTEEKPAAKPADYTEVEKIIHEMKGENK